ncbi:Nn.00g007370.m01.CDS01 [Neocucurbitaria sp. VM-36]
MSLTLTPATGDWVQPPSAEQSPVEPTHFQNARHMSNVLLTRVQAFIHESANHLDGANVSSKDFIQQWKTTFESCLIEFGAEYGKSESQVNDERLENVPMEAPTNMSASLGEHFDKSDDGLRVEGSQSDAGEV